MNIFTINSNSIPVISTLWSSADIWSHIKLRWGIGRNNSKIEPGIYAVGTPDSSSDVFVSANYTLSFNHLRRGLEGINAWILVLDTNGVNVWCAAGKGTFGTSELVVRVNHHQLNKIVNHKRIIVPQLGATGISAHTVKKRIGYQVIYGPVRASDINKFIANGYKATPEMRTVNFPIKDRIKLIPVELVYGGKYLLIIPLVLFLLSGISSNGYSFGSALINGWNSVLNISFAFLAGCVLTPIFLPYIPFKRFSLKGLAVSLATVPLLIFIGSIKLSMLDIASWLLIIASISSFMSMNFTGSSTYTSLSGVKKEMKLFLPLQIASVVVGFFLWILSLLINR